MKRFASVLVAPLLIALLIVTTSCTSKQETTVTTCLGKIGLQVLSSAVEHSALQFKNLLEVAPDCLDAAIAAFDFASSSSEPQVTILEAPAQGSFTGSVDSATLDNCTAYTSQYQFEFRVPFIMAVGTQDSLGTFTSVSDASGSADNDLVARALFDQYSSVITSHTTAGPSATAPVYGLPQAQITLTLPIRLNYMYGTARLVNNGVTSYLPWFFPVSFERAGDVTYTTSSC